VSHEQQQPHRHINIAVVQMETDDKDASAPVVEVQPLQPDFSGRENETSPQLEQPYSGPKSKKMLTTLWRWSPAIFMASYFVFSISIYTLSPREAVKVLWFLYLTIGTILAGIALLEAYDGLSLLREARKAVSKHAQSEWTDDASLPHIELILDDDKKRCASLCFQIRATMPHWSTTSATYKIANRDHCLSTQQCFELKTHRTLML
jgi:hypothetical protein